MNGQKREWGKVEGGRLRERGKRVMAKDGLDGVGGRWFAQRRHLSVTAEIGIGVHDCLFGGLFIFSLLTFF